MTVEELKAQLAHHEATIKEYRAIGKAWALDSRQLAIAEHNASHIRAELRSRHQENA